MFLFGRQDWNCLISLNQCIFCQSTRAFSSDKDWNKAHQIKKKHGHRIVISQKLLSVPTSQKTTQALKLLPLRETNYNSGKKKKKKNKKKEQEKIQPTHLTEYIKDNYVIKTNNVSDGKRITRQEWMCWAPSGSHQIIHNKNATITKII